MWPYWLLLLLPVWMAVNKRPIRRVPSPWHHWPPSWRWVFWGLTLMIGLRHEVGGDWGNYLPHVERAGMMTLGEVFRASDPGYAFFNWLGARWGGAYLVNSLCAMVFTWGLVVFCRAQPRPWLALAVAAPYLVMVVGMGYTRQGIAAGFEMLGLVALGEARLGAFLAAVALAATFHKSAVILVPMVALLRSRYWLVTVLIAGLAGLVLYRLLLEESVDHLMAGYVEAGMESTGAAIRLAMNALPAAIFLLFRKRFPLSPAQRAFWTWMCLAAWGFVGLLIVSPSSTAVDRVALYWIPLQLFVWSRAPDALSQLLGSKSAWVRVIVAYSALVHFTWLNFATHAKYWLPYQFYPWTWLWE